MPADTFSERAMWCWLGKDRLFHKDITRLATVMNANVFGEPNSSLCVKAVYNSSN